MTTEKQKKVSIEEIMKSDAAGAEFTGDRTFVDAKKLEDTTVEYGGPRGKEPTRFGDWEQKGRCTDF